MYISTTEHLDLKKLFIPKEELIKLVRYNTYLILLLVELDGTKVIVFYLKNDDILKKLSKFTNFTKI